MLSLTKKSEYGLVAVCHLAREQDKVVSARDIAERHHVPLPLLMNVLKSLNQAGIISSTRGARGGYQLAVDPTQLSLQALIEAIEGPVRFVPCAPGADGGGRGCDRTGFCDIRRPLHRVHEAFRDFLDCITIAELAHDRVELNPHLGNHAAPAAKVIAS